VNHASGEQGRIGPNAILQLLPVLEAAGDAALRDQLLAEAGVVEVPDGTAMIPEGPVARLHQALRRARPDAAELARQAGRGTADYILAHRIPALVQVVLKRLPAALSGRLLARAIAKNAWTFAGSGSFRVVSMKPMLFSIADNPVVRGEVGDHPLCDWHVAVFERLFQVLVDPRTRVVETKCCAEGAAACLFEVSFGR
jgi:divinyl protochlorophyllide a 8-vinyl-reductase